MPKPMTGEHCAVAARETVALAKSLGYAPAVPGLFEMENLERLAERMETEPVFAEMPDKANRFLGSVQAACITGCGGRLTNDDIKRINAAAAGWAT